MPAPIVAYWEARVAYWKAIPDDLKITIGLAVLAALLLALAIWWLWWRLPKRMAARLALDDPKARGDAEDNFRKTVGQALGGVVVLLGAGVAYLQFSQQQQAAHDLLISNQVAKGFELLGNKDKDALVLRLGGIYALEGVMNGSDQYHQPVLEALTAFVRENAPLRIWPALQAALTVIGRRSAGPGSIHLTITDLSNANLTRANLHGAYMDGANLFRAYLGHADLSAASLSDARLSGAYMVGANLTHAYLEGVDLDAANLSDADLSAANLTGAILDYADLTGAILDGQKQLDAACGSDVKLPPGLTTLKPCPPESPPP